MIGVSIALPFMGKKNKTAVRFDGVDDLIQTPVGNGINPFEEELIFYFLVKVNQFTQYNSLFGSKNGTNQRLYINAASGKWGIGIQSQSTLLGSESVKIGIWQTIKLEIKQGFAKLYVDGILSQTIEFTPYTLASNFMIGSNIIGYLAGDIACCRIYRNGIPWLIYEMEDGVGLTVLDSSDNGNTGDIIGGTWVEV